MKPRNHLVPLALKRKAGSHTKSVKSIRRKEKVEVNRIASSIG